MIDLETKTVTKSFSAGTVDLNNIDTKEEGIIDQTSSLENVPREPDGITFIGNDYLATADEGDLEGGSRGFTIFELDGNIVSTSGNTMEHIAAKVGHYPEERSGNKGNEPKTLILLLLRIQTISLLIPSVPVWSLFMTFPNPHNRYFSKYFLLV